MRPFGFRLSAVAILLSFLALTASAGPVVVLPSTAGQPAQIFDEQLEPIGTVTLPTGAFKALVSPQGDRIAILSTANAAAVSFLQIVNNRVSGELVSRSLGGNPASVGAISPDGKYLVVGAAVANGPVFVFDVTSMQQVGGPIALSGSEQVIDLAFSLNSQQVFVLTNQGNIIPISIAGSPHRLSPNLDNRGTKPTALHISPTGRLFATAQGKLHEYRTTGAFEWKGTSDMDGNENPEKMIFTLNGRYGIAINKTPVYSTILLYNLDMLGTNRAGQTPSIARVGGLPLPGGVFSAAQKAQSLAPWGERGCIVLLQDLKQVYELNLTDAGGFSAAVEPSFEGLGKLSGVTGIGVSGELSNTEFLFASTGAELHRLRYEYSQTSTRRTDAGTRTISPGTISVPAVSSTGQSSRIIGYGGGIRVPLNSPALTFSVRILDTRRIPLFGKTVTFSALTNAPQVSDATVVTNADGIASVQVTPAAIAGDFSVLATGPGGETVTITATVDPTIGGGDDGNDPGGNDPPPGVTRFIRKSGDGQIGLIGFGAVSGIQPLVARLVDPENKPIVGRDVTVAAAGGAILLDHVAQRQLGENTTLKTDANGEVTISWIPLGSTSLSQAYLPYTFTFTADVATTDFRGVGFSSEGGQFYTPSILIQKPTLESPLLTVRLGETLENAVRIGANAEGALGRAPLPGVALEVTSPNQNPEAGPVVSCGEQAPLTNTEGIGVCNLTASGRTGETSITIHVGGTFRRFTGFRVLVTPGVQAPRIQSGDNQSGDPGSVLPAPLTIKVDDGSGNSTAGTPVVWTVLQPGRLALEQPVTSLPANGIATAGVRLGTTPGIYKVRATVGAKSVEFTVTVKQFTTFTLSAVSGGGQETYAGQTYANPLVVKVADPLGTPIPGITVTFAVNSGQATLGAATVATNAQGLAQTTVTAGSAAGLVSIQASLPGLAPITFNLTVRIQGPGVTADSFMSVGSLERKLTPGGLIYIAGTNLLKDVVGQVNALMLTGQLPLSLGGLTVEFQGSGGGAAYAPFYAVSNSNGYHVAMVQVPYELIGPTVTAIVRGGNGGVTTVTGIPLAPVVPSIYRETFNDVPYATVVRADGSIVRPNNPARRGERVRMYATGLGQTAPQASTNRLGVENQSITGSALVGMAGAGVQVVSVYMAPNLIGIYEVVFDIPEDAPVGDAIPLALLITPVAGGDAGYDASNPVISIAQ